MLTDAVPGRERCASPLRGLLSGALGLLVLLIFVGGGCSPDSFLVSDEDRDRNFQRARDAERLGDYAAAAEHYERALDRNPRAAAVHLGYASLSEFQLRRYADAVYHYQRYLRLRPDDPKADDIRRRITNCTERLATSVPLVIRSETIARDLESVRGDNQSLRLQVSNLVATATYWSNEWRRLSSMAPQLPPAVPDAAGSAAVSSNRPAGSANRTPPNRSALVPAPGSSPGSAAASRSLAPRSGSVPTPRTSGTVPPGLGSVRYHRVTAGETLESIARRYGVTGAALRRANPQIEPRRLRPGMDVRIPSR